MSEHGPPTDGLSQTPGSDTSVGAFRVLDVGDDGGGRHWRAANGRLTIGSHAGNDVVLADSTVSRFHCELVTEADGVWVTDLDSRNGTLVDGTRVRVALLRHGHVLRLGRAAVRFERLAERDPVDVSPRHEFGTLVGSSQAMRRVFAQLERAAPTEATVLLEGETGTGKGAIAEALHAASPRAKGPFVVVDCGALSSSLLESELFGHEKGAFTGADARRIGAFEEASGGTIFLDEVGELPADMQPHLLRVLEHRTVRRVGHNAHTPVDLRIVAATHRDLRALVNDGRFRADLYYRLAVVRIRIPALRERPGDLPELVATLLRGRGATPAQTAQLTSPSSLDRLAASTWPGNVRELRNHLERSLVLDDAVDDAAGDAGSGESLQDARHRNSEAFERRYLEELMRRHGKVVTAARAAGVARVYLYRLLAKHGLSPRR
jgi:DNA-binding NtrC family response regulator|nr:sigma 54-interacting transcriptional regulator [Kofleriaceae bacterium]